MEMGLAGVDNTGSTLTVTRGAHKNQMGGNSDEDETDIGFAGVKEGMEEDAGTVDLAFLARCGGVKDLLRRCFNIGRLCFKDEASTTSACAICNASS